MSNASDFIIEDGILKKYKGSDENVVIPDNVTYIGGHAFASCSSLVSVTIPESVRTIDVQAFWMCSSLTSVMIPDSVTDIELGAFRGCNALADVNGFIIVRGVLYDYCGEGGDIVIPNSATSIGSYAFENCSNLTSVTIPEGVTSIGDSAFENCSNLTSVTIPEGVTSIGYSVFMNCRSLTSITVPNSVTSISAYAFAGCENLARVILPDSVTSIGRCAFGGCKKLNLQLPHKLASIEEAAFNECALSCIVIPPAVTQVGKNAFLRCNKIKTAGPVGGGYDYEFSWTEEIPANAFSGLRKLKKAVLPATVKKIGNNAFHDCKELVDLTMPKTAKVSKTAFSGCLKLTETKDASIEVAATASAVKSSKDVKSFVSDFSVVNGRLIQYNGCDTEVVIPDGVTAIGRRVFYLSSIVSVTIPASVDTVEREAFSWCQDLKTITILGRIKKVEADAFGDISKVCASIPLRAFSKATQRDALYAFIKKFPELDSKSEILCDNLAFIGAHLKETIGSSYHSDFEYLNALVANDELRHAVLDTNAIPAKDIEWLTEQLQQKKHPEIVAEMLDYRNKLLDDPNVRKSLEKSRARAEEKALSPKMSAADWRKIFKFSYDNGAIVITGTKVSDKVITVPTEIGIKKVRTIGRDAFSFASTHSPEKIIISEGIEEIRRRAFMCVEDTEVFFPSSIVSLPEGTFIAVQGLTLHLTASVTEIAKELFWDSVRPIKAIHAPAGSYAEQYAKDNNIPFVAE